MGNNVSTPDCFVWAQLPKEKFEELLAERFTVIRTSGEKQDGWRIPSTSHFCHEGKWVKYHAHAWDHLTDGKGEKSWRFHMVLEDSPGAMHCCGWRRVRTFWPTRLTTPEQREAWWLEMDALLASLKRTADLSEDERAAIESWEALRDEEVNGPLRREIAAKIDEFYKEHETKQEERRLEAAEMASRHAWWNAFDAEHAELKAAIKADKEAEGMPPEQAALFAISVSNDIMGAKQRDVLAAIPEGAAKVWPSGTALEIWATQKAKAKILAEVKLAFPTFSLEDQERRADYAFKNPNYWAPWRQWVQTTTPEQRAKRRIQDQDWGMCYSHEH